METRNLLTANPATSATAAATGPAGSPLPALPADALVIVPVRNLVLFPGIVLPVALGRERSVAAAQEAARSERPIGLVLQRDPEIVQPGAADLHEVGTAAAILRYVTGQDGGHHIIAQGQERFRIVEF